jgi:hypothetical protein
MPFRSSAALGFLALLSSCAEEAPYRDLAEPLSVEDLQPFPAEVTRENARSVVRRGLQAHRRSNNLPDEQYGYSFGEAGFVQLYHFNPTDRVEERAGRTYVDFSRVRSVTTEEYFDFKRLGERFRITLRGSFSKWDSPVRVGQRQPDLGREPSKRECDALLLVLDDPAVAKKLADALILLSGRQG